METHALPLSLAGGSDPGGFIFETTSSLKVNQESCLSELSAPPFWFGWGNLRNIKHHGFIVTMVRSGAFMDEDAFKFVDVFLVG
jgi:hypothetical protein